MSRAASSLAELSRPPLVSAGKLPTYVIIGLALPLAKVHYYMVSGTAAGSYIERWTGWVEPNMITMALATCILLADTVLTWVERRGADALYEFLKDVGQSVSSGNGVETALVETCRKRGGGPGRFFRAAIRRAQAEPLEDALLQTARRRGDDRLFEASGLCSRAIRAGGEVGRIVRQLGERFSVNQELVRFAESELNGSIALLRGLALGLFPYLFGLVASMFQFPIEPHGPRFFAFVALSAGATDFRIYGSWRRAVAKQPFYVGLSYLVMQAGVDAGLSFHQ